LVKETLFEFENVKPDGLTDAVTVLPFVPKETPF
jgi:hypothetical protein